MFTQENWPRRSPGPTQDPSERQRSKLRTISMYLWIVIAAVAAVQGARFYLQWEAGREMRQKAVEKKRAEDQRAVELLGGNRFEILEFYASPGVIARGASVTLCYGVSNAKSVRLDPPAGDIWPALNHCLEASPTKDTTYTLTAQDAQGNTKTATVKVLVR